MTKQRISIDSTPLHVAAIITITFIFYYSSLHNFFYADDFIWLDRAKHLDGNWSSIFNIENRYFTPLTYVSFYLNLTFFGLDPFWYHFFDISLHAINGVLLYFLAWQLSGKRLTSFIAAILFVTSFALPICVLWPSERTDTIMCFFSLVTIITYLKTVTNKRRLLPVVFYVLALCAKGTALILPAVLFLLTSKSKPLKSRIQELIPYLAVNAVYAFLLLLCNALGARKIAPPNGMESFGNYIKGFAAMIAPESHLAETSTIFQTAGCAFIILALIIFAARTNDNTARVGVALAVFGVLPLVFNKQYFLAGSIDSDIALLASPSSRVYLAYTGIALVIAVALEKIARTAVRVYLRILIALVVMALLCLNYKEIHSRNERWHSHSNDVRHDLYRLITYADLQTKNSILFLYNFVGSPGFSSAMINTFFDVHDVEVQYFDFRSIDVVTDPDKSTFYRALNVMYPVKQQIILSCPEKPEEAQLNYKANQLLQIALSQYYDLHSNTSKEMEIASKANLDGSMHQLRNVFSSCQNTF